MATITVDAGTVSVTFSATEKLLGLVRDQRFPVSSVLGAREVGRWRDDVRGLRVGLGLPGHRLLGTWYGRHHRQLVSLRTGRPAVLVQLRDERYDELLVECDDPQAVISRLSR